eukprot:UN12179
MEALKLNKTKWNKRYIHVNYATNGFPHSLKRTPFTIREDTDIDPSITDDIYVGTRDKHLPWPNKPYR